MAALVAYDNTHVFIANNVIHNRYMPDSCFYILFNSPIFSVGCSPYKPIKFFIFAMDFHSPDLLITTEPGMSIDMLCVMIARHN